MVFVTKANGERQEFSEEKLRNSIKRAGIPHDLENEAVAHVKAKLHEGIKTAEIYKHIIEFLDKPESSHHKARYSLKQAIMELGPTGFPFEDFLGKLLTAEGFTTQVRQILLGTCISHEIDVVAKRGKDTVMVEAKYHNSTGIKTDVHVALYTWARFEDVAKKHGFTNPLLVTNTKATTDVIAYATCVGMDVISWDYPKGDSLREAIEAYSLYPITALTSLPQSYKQQLLQQGIVLCKDICTNPSVITSLGLSAEEKRIILEQSAILCQRIS